jgi:hypothetical protein
MMVVQMDERIESMQKSRSLIEKQLSRYYSARFQGMVSCFYDESKRAYAISGNALPAHPDLQGKYPNGWSMSDHVPPRKARELVKDWTC